MGRPRLYATSVERPSSPSAAAKQAAQDLAAWECVGIQQALQTRALTDQSWELYELIDAWSRDVDMPRRGPEGRPSGLVAGASAYFYGMAAARVRRHRRALQRLAQVRAVRGAQVSGPRAARAESTVHEPSTKGCEAPWHKTSVLPPSICYPHNAWKINDRFAHFSGGFCVTHARGT